MTGQGMDGKGPMRVKERPTMGHIWVNDWSRRGHRGSNIGQGRVTEGSRKGQTKSKNGQCGANDGSMKGH